MTLTSGSKYYSEIKFFPIGFKIFAVTYIGFSKMLLLISSMTL